MSTLQPSEHLFALLNFCGIRPRDIAQRLGVSRPLVTLWRKDERDVSAAYHAALIVYAEELFWGQVHAWQEEVAERDVPRTEVLEYHQRMRTFGDLVVKAMGERNPQFMQSQVLNAIHTLGQYVLLSGPLPWDDETLRAVEGTAYRLISAVEVLRAQIAVTQTAPLPTMEPLATQLMAFVERLLQQVRPLPNEA